MIDSLDVSTQRGLAYRRCKPFLPCCFSYVLPPPHDPRTREAPHSSARSLTRSLVSFFYIKLGAIK